MPSVIVVVVVVFIVVGVVGIRGRVLIHHELFGFIKSSSEKKEKKSAGKKGDKRKRQTPWIIMRIPVAITVPWCEY